MKKMNLIKKFSMLLLVFVALFGFTIQAKAAAPESFTMSAPKRLDSYISTVYFNYKTTSNGTVVYCTEFVKNPPPAGTYFTKNRQLDAGIAYILENGYPNKKFTGNNNQDYYITQLAMWWYIDKVNGTSSSITTRFESGKFDSYSLTPYVKQLKDGALNAKSKGYATPSIKLSTNNVNLTISGDKKYFVSQTISVKTSSVSGNYTVKLTSAPSGTIVTDVNGNSKTTFAQNEGFIVKVPASSIGKDNLKNTISLSVSATGSVNKAYEYKTTQVSTQNVTPAVLYPETSTVSDNLSLNLNSSGVKISKQDITSKKELPGATLVVKDEKGNQIDKWVSKDEPHYIYNLASGTYYLTETIAPEGYVLSTETIKFTINNDGSVQTVVMYNTQKEEPVVKISKQDITSKEELPGATLTIKDSKGKVVATWVSTNEPYYLTLKPGKYTLQEDIAPEGYVLSSEIIEFEVEDDGEITTVIMYNEQIAEEVVVPITDSSSTLIYILSIVMIIGGLGLVYYYKKIRQQG